MDIEADLALHLSTISQLAGQTELQSFGKLEVLKAKLERLNLLLSHSSLKETVAVVRSVVQEGLKDTFDSDIKSLCQHILIVCSCARVRKHPTLLSLPEQTLVDRIVRLTLTVPRANVAVMLKLRPSLLLRKVFYILCLNATHL